MVDIWRGGENTGLFQTGFAGYRYALKFSLSHCRNFTQRALLALYTGAETVSTSVKLLCFVPSSTPGIAEN